MNLTGTKIKDTYPDVVTIGNNNTIENGTGSNIPFLNISASYSIITYVTSSTTSVSASYSESSSYAPNPFPDITDINQAIGINQTNPQYALDVNGKIGNSQYGNINNIQVDDGGGNIIISPAIGINLNSNLNGNNITVEDGSGNMGLVATSGLELYSNLNGNDINLEDGSGNISLTAASRLDLYSNLNGNDITLDDGSGNISLTAASELIINGTASATAFIGSGSQIIGIVSSSYSNSSSYSRNSLSSSYSPIQLPDITDIDQAIGINQTNPQYTLDVNGVIGNSEYGTANSITFDDGSGNMSVTSIGNLNIINNNGLNFLQVNPSGVYLSSVSNIQLTSNLNGNYITLDDGIGDINLTAASGLELYSYLNGNNIQLDDWNGNINLTAANDFNFNGTDIKLNGTSIVGGGGSLTLPVILNDGGGNGTLNISSDGNSDYTIGQSQGGNIGFGIDGNVDLYDTAGSHISLDDSNNITLTAPTNIQLTSNLNGNNIQLDDGSGNINLNGYKLNLTSNFNGNYITLEDGTGNMNLTAASGRINLNGATSIKTAEGDTFYAHTVAGNLVWTTSP